MPLLLLLCLWSVAQAGTVHVAVASNFTATLRELEPLFRAESGHSLRISTGSTGKHYAQIVRGAPYELFLAADAQRPARLEREGHIVAGSRFTYALGRLVWWQPGRAADGPLALPPGGRLALANPRLAPYGWAARAWLEARGWWQPLRRQQRLVLGENVAQAFHFVHAGHADIGLVAYAQWLKLPPDERGEARLLQGHPPIEQQVVLLRDTPAARAFWRFLQTEPARVVIRQAGYDLP